MTNPRPEQLGVIDESFLTSGGVPPDGSVIRAGSNIAVLLDTFVPQIAGGRLTIDDAGFDPVPDGDLTGKTELYYVPYDGIEISLYNGSKWVPHDFFPSLSISNAGLSADLNYDVFVQAVNDELSLSLVAWNSAGPGAGSRITSLVLQDGIYVLSTDVTKRYVGTIRTTASVEFEDSNLNRFVWNAYNRVERVSVAKPNAIFTSGVATTTWATAHSDSDLELNFVIGLPTEVHVDLAVSVEENANGRDALNTSFLNIDGVPSQGASSNPVFYLDDSKPLWGHLGTWIATPDYYKAVASYQTSVAGSVEYRSNDPFSPGGYILAVLG